MPSLTSTRWALAGILAGLSAVAVVATFSKDPEQYSYVPNVGTDIREPGLLFGSAGLGGIMIMRSAGFLLPKPWRVYVDRLEFAFVTMLWILWTSATMAFSASTISKTICLSHSNTSIPQCSTLTFDLLLLHVLSLASFAYLLVVLSTALSPGYITSHSPSLAGLEADSDGIGGEEGSVFVMWDLALGGSPKVSAADLPVEAPRGYETVYGTAAPVRATGSTADTGTEPATETATIKADRFARGRVGMYTSLLVTSMAAVLCICTVAAEGFPGLAAMSVLGIALASIAFTSSFLCIHRRQIFTDLTSESIRRYRALELGTILALFILWPIAATLYTLSPSSSARPCKSQDGSSPNDDGNGAGPDTTDDWLSVCDLTLLTLSLSWFCAWIALARAVNLVFPMPDSTDKPSIAIPNPRHSRGLSAGGEGQPLLSPTTAKMPRPGEAGGARAKSQVERPQVKYGRLVAGEAFELGDEEDD